MLGLIIICILLASFFILVITLLCKSYTKDIIELEERVLQNEKTYNDYVLKEEFFKEHDRVFTIIKDLVKRFDNLEELTVFKKINKKDMEELKKLWKESNEIFTWHNVPENMIIDEKGIKFKGKDGEDKMACKKGRGGKKK